MEYFFITVIAAVLGYYVGKLTVERDNEGDEL